MTSRHAKWPLAGVLTGLVILTSGALPSEAQMRPSSGTVQGHQSLQEQLGLTDEQIQSLREIRDRHRQGMRETARALRQARRALRDLVLQQADEGTISAKQAEVQQLVARFIEGRTQSLRDLVSVLTPEQRERFRELRPFRRHGGYPLAG